MAFLSAKARLPSKVSVHCEGDETVTPGLVQGKWQRLAGLRPCARP